MFATLYRLTRSATLVYTSRHAALTGPANAPPPVHPAVRPHPVTLVIPAAPRPGPARQPAGPARHPGQELHRSQVPPILSLAAPLNGIAGLTLMPIALHNKLDAAREFLGTVRERQPTLIAGRHVILEHLDHAHLCDTITVWL